MTTRRPMRAITLRHPWPLAFLRLGKDVENRMWAPHELLPGEQLALHAGAAPKVNKDGRIADDYGAEIVGAMEWITRQGLRGSLPDVFTMGDLIAESPASAVFMVATYRGAVRESRSRWFAGKWGWELADRIALPKPVPCRGAQGLWQLHADVDAAVRAQLSLDAAIARTDAALSKFPEVPHE